MDLGIASPLVRWICIESFGLHARNLSPISIPAFNARTLHDHQRVRACWREQRTDVDCALFLLGFIDELAHVKLDQLKLNPSSSCTAAPHFDWRKLDLTISAILDETLQQKDC